MELSFSDTLRFRRQQLKLSQADVAELSGISRNYVSMIERGLFHRVSIYVLGNVCNALGLRLKLDVVDKEVQAQS